MCCMLFGIIKTSSLWSTVVANLLNRILNEYFFGDTIGHQNRHTIKSVDSQNDSQKNQKAIGKTANRIFYTNGVRAANKF